MSTDRYAFRVGAPIASDATADVFQADAIAPLRRGDTDRERLRVALKLFHAPWSGDPDPWPVRDRLAELARIECAAVVKVHTFTSVAGRRALAMERVSGVDVGTLARHLAARGELLPPAAVFEIGLAVAGALDAALRGTAREAGVPLGLAHGALRASKVLVTTRGTVKVLGFGFPVAGPAPEPEDDVFALGVLLHELLTGEPWAGAPRSGWADAAGGEVVLGIRVGPGRVLEGMLSPEPARRPRAAQLLPVLDSALRHLDPEALAELGRTAVPAALAARPAPVVAGPGPGAVLVADAVTRPPRPEGAGPTVSLERGLARMLLAQHLVKLALATAAAREADHPLLGDLRERIAAFTAARYAADLAAAALAPAGGPAVPVGGGFAELARRGFLSARDAADLSRWADALAGDGIGHADPDPPELQLEALDRLRIRLAEAAAEG